MAQSDPWKQVPRAKRIVVKIGSSTLTRDGQLRPAKFTAIARDVFRVRERGHQVVVVSSGAIAIGSGRLGWDHNGRTIREKQAAAAVGQIGLVELYQRRFARHGLHVGQVLLTRAGLENRERFMNARHTMLELLGLGVVPIVNENDTVATEEIRFGDNDNLAATIVNVVGGDLLVILTDVEGLYERPPEAGQPKPPLIRTVAKITPAVERIASGAGSRYGSGGMITKLRGSTKRGTFRCRHDPVSRPDPRDPREARLRRAPRHPLRARREAARPQALARLHGQEPRPDRDR